MLASENEGHFISPGAYDDSSNNINKHRFNYQQTSSGGSTSSHHNRLSSSGSTSSDTAHLLNLNQDRRVQNSLQRLEKQQDEFFEL